MQYEYIDIAEHDLSKPLLRPPRANRENRLQLRSDGKLIGAQSEGPYRAVLDLLDPIVNFEITKTGTTTGGLTNCVVAVRMLDPEGKPLAVPGALLRGRLCTNGLHGVHAGSGTTIVANTGCTTMAVETTAKDVVISNKANVAATGTLNISGVVVDGQTVTIGSRVYQFRTGLTALTSGNVEVDVSARGTKASGTLTIAEPVTAGDTIVIGDQTYVFVTGAANAPGEIGIGANEAATKVNIPAAINGTDGINTANTKVVAASEFSSDTLALTARFTGIQGNSIVTAELGQGLTHASNVFSGATLANGVDVSAAHAVTDLVAAITNDASAVVTAVDGAGDTVVVTAKTTGVGGNSIATTETMANGAWDASTLAGGATGDESLFEFAITNGADETLTFRIGPSPVGKQIKGNFDASIQLIWSA
jgi:hypothetical protein